MSGVLEGGVRLVDGICDGGCVYVYMIYEVLRLRPGCLGGVWKGWARRLFLLCVFGMEMKWDMMTSFVRLRGGKFESSTRYL
jgi:hypothetical protein